MRAPLLFLEARIIGRDAFRALPSFCNCYDVTVPILIGMFMSKFEAQRRLILNAFLFFLATCLRLKRRPDVPFVEWSVQIVERARMVAHRAKHRRNQEMPAHKGERSNVSDSHYFSVRFFRRRRRISNHVGFKFFGFFLHSS